MTVSKGAIAGLALMEQPADRANRRADTKASGMSASPTTGPRRFALSDAGNAEFFAARYGRDCRFDHQRQRWLFWRDERWRPDRDGERHRLAKAAMRARLKCAADVEDEGHRRAEVQHALASESRGRLEALLSLTKSEHPIADAGDGWDADRWLLGVQNSIVDLRTGALRAATRDDRVSFRATVNYQPDATSDVWEGALRSILPDEDMRVFMQKAIGYSATGCTRCDMWFLLEGTGRNGKGTVIQPIRRALGDYALELPASVLDARANRAAYELANLPGRRFVTSSEAGDTIRLNHDRIKQLTGGDSMSVANKYEKSFQCDPVAKLWLSCNRLPAATDDSPAFWARVRRIPFKVSFLGREDHALRPTLTDDPAHQVAILAWIVRGAMRYYAEGLGDPPEAVRVATEAYRDDSDELSAFLSEACERVASAEIGATALFEHYLRWADASHLTPVERLTSTAFGRRMGTRFEAKKHPRSGVKHYQGVAPKVRS